MSAIGREGGHSRGARARAAAQGGNSISSSDTARNPNSEQVFERQVNTERSGFESQRNERERERERGGNIRNERESEQTFGGRDRI